MAIAGAHPVPAAARPDLDGSDDDDDVNCALVLVERAASRGRTLERLACVEASAAPGGAPFAGGQRIRARGRDANPSRPARTRAAPAGSSRRRGRGGGRDLHAALAAPGGARGRRRARAAAGDAAAAAPARCARRGGARGRGGLLRRGAAAPRRQGGRGGGRPPRPGRRRRRRVPAHPSAAAGPSPWPRAPTRCAHPPPSPPNRHPAARQGRGARTCRRAALAAAHARAAHAARQ
jgi:hypothetical protein